MQRRAERRRALLDIARQAVAACDGEPLCRAVAAELEPAAGPVHVLGAGKASVAMARGLLAGLGAPVAGGLLVTKDGHGDRWSGDGLELRFAGHPEPDPRSVDVGRAALGLVARLSASDRLLVLLSGGASALLATPLPPLELGELVQATRAMLGAGVPIDEINLVRRHLTGASGGRLARACRATTEVWLLSDVLSGELSAIGSGPFAPEPGSFSSALAAARRVPQIGARVLALLERGARSLEPTTPAPADACFSRVRHRVLASVDHLLDAAVEGAMRQGVTEVRRLGPSGGDVAQVAARFAALAPDLGPGELAIGGGEPTVVLPAEPGRGGRSQQLALRLAEALHGGRPACFAAVCSDGGDGPTDAAGAVVDEHSWSELLRLGDPGRALRRADAYPLLDAAGALVRTGPTGTNVLDLHLLWAC